MSGWLAWLTTYVPLASTPVVALATVALAIFNYRYVRLTRRLVQESQRSREPLVTIDFEMPERNQVRLVVANHGLSPARDIRITVDRDIQWTHLFGAKAFSEFGVMRNGISYLTPSRKFKYLVGIPNLTASEDALQAEFRIDYADNAGKRYHDSIIYDFTAFREVLFESFKDPNLMVAEAIRKAERSRERQGRPFDLGVSRTKKCSMCAETIPAEAKKCSHCLELQVRPALQPVEEDSGGDEEALGPPAAGTHEDRKPPLDL